MTLLKYWKSLDRPGKEAFAKRCGYSLRYMIVHLMQPRPTRGVNLSWHRIEKISRATRGEVSEEGVRKHFKRAVNVQTAA